MGHKSGLSYKRSGKPRRQYFALQSTSRQEQNLAFPLASRANDGVEEARLQLILSFEGPGSSF